jgi:hypothetical protein
MKLCTSICWTILASLAYQLSGQVPSPGSGKMQTYVISDVSSPEFPQMMAKWSPDFLNKDENASLRGGSFFLTNNDSRSIVAYAIRWDVGDASGKTKSSFAIFDGSSSPTKAPLPHSLIIPPGGTRIVSPRFNLDVSLLRDPDVQNHVRRIPLRPDIAQAIANGRRVAGSIDGAVFEDGHIEGPNESHFFERLKAERDAEHDSGLVVVASLQAGETDEQIIEKLQGDVTKGASHTGTTQADLYWSARGRAASELIGAYQRLGHSALVANARTRVTQPRMHLQQ